PLQLADGLEDRQSGRGWFAAPCEEPLLWINATSLERRRNSARAGAWRYFVHQPAVRAHESAHSRPCPRKSFAKRRRFDPEHLTGFAAPQPEDNAADVGDAIVAVETQQPG